MDEEYLKRLGLSIARGVPQMATGFVDLAALPFTLTGLLEPEEAVGSTAYLTSKGLLPPPQEGVIPETLEMVSGAMSPGGAGKELLGGLLGLTAYHGSPYLFKQFDPRKIGTGEGAQAYGAGAGYTAESRPTAEFYKSVLGAKDQDLINNAIERLVYFDNKDTTKIRDALILEGFDRSKITPELENSIKKIVKETNIDDGSVSDLAIKEYKKLEKLVPSSGYLYKGDIPDEIIPSFLDWDKPLKNQDALNKLKNNPELVDYAKKKGIDVGDIQGRDVYELIASGFDVGQKEAYQMATDYLDNLGVRGIRYLDQGSRKAGEGTSNFVVFRPEDYKIESINDQPIEEWIKKGLLD